MFTRQHYKTIADIISTEHFYRIHGDDHCSACVYGVEAIARQLANYFTKDNPHFDRARFLETCGL